MRALVYTAPRSVEMQEVPAVVAGPGEVEIQIAAGGICGSDMSGFLGHSRRRIAPLVLGHELVGRLGNGKRVVANPLVSCGRCRACLAGAQNLCSTWRLLGMDRTQGCLTERVAIPERQVYAIPDSLTDEQAVLTEPLANIVHLFRIAAPLPFFRMGIVGAGTMGALALQGAVRLCVKEILIQDVSDARLAEAMRMGATVAANVSTEAGRALAQEFTGDGLDLVLDASGAGPARQAAFDLCRPGGQVVLLGMGAERSEVDFVTSIRKEHRVVMSFAYTPGDFEQALKLLVKGEVDLTAWTRTMPLEAGQAAFDQMANAPGTTLKMLLRVN